jgi:hypothetical protein
MKLSVTIPTILKGEFQLHPFRDGIFRVNLNASYDDQIVIDVKMKNGKWSNFSRGTLKELLSSVVR